MADDELEVTWKGNEASLVLREEGDTIKGYVGKKHVLTLEFGDDDELNETFCHDDLEYDEEELAELLLEDEEDDGDYEEDNDHNDNDEDDEDDDDEDAIESEQTNEDSNSRGARKRKHEDTDDTDSKTQ